LDFSRKPIADAVVRVYASAMTPPMILGEARTAPDGAFSMFIPSVDLLMRVAVIVGAEEHLLLEVIDNNDGAVSVSLGTVLVSSTPLFSIGTRAIYGIHEEILSGVERVIAARDEIGVEATVGDLLKGTANNLADVRAVLREGGLDVGPLTIEMKALVPAPGMLKLIGKSELSQVQGEQLSTIRFQLEPATQAQTAAPKASRIPDVSGYTESLARRKLQNEGFGVRVAREVVEDPPTGPSLVGRVVRLDPPQGTSIPAGSVVTLYIGERAG
jgi:hypothetical protein